MTTTATTTTSRASVRPADSGRWLIWTAGLIVAAGAAVATAHGLYRVALAATVPPPIGWLYPLITDGLALVAYAATTRLAAGGRAYAWAVVVLAAGLSGLAQASYLAIGVHTAPVQLRFGVGAWPAIAAAITAHLLYLLAARPGTVRPNTVRPDVVRADSELPYDAVRSGTVRPAVVQASVLRPVPAVRNAGTNDGPGPVQLSGPVPATGSVSAHDDSAGRDGPLNRSDRPDAGEAQPLPGAHGPVRPDQPVRPDVVQPSPVRPDLVRPVRPASSDRPAAVRPDGAEPRTAVPAEPVVRPVVRPPVRPEQPDRAAPYESAADRAHAAAVVHRMQHDGLPTVSELMGLADVGRGTAGLALKRLRDLKAGTRPGLQVVGDADA